MTTEEKKTKAKEARARFKDGKTSFKVLVTTETMERWKKFAKYEGYGTVTGYVVNAVEQHIKDFAKKVSEEVSPK